MSLVNILEKENPGLSIVQPREGKSFFSEANDYLKLMNSVDDDLIAKGTLGSLKNLQNKLTESLKYFQTNDDVKGLVDKNDEETFQEAFHNLWGTTSLAYEVLMDVQESGVLDEKPGNFDHYILILKEVDQYSNKQIRTSMNLAINVLDKFIQKYEN